MSIVVPFAFLLFSLPVCYSLPAPYEWFNFSKILLFSLIFVVVFKKAFTNFVRFVAPFLAFISNQIMILHQIFSCVLRGAGTHFLNFFSLQTLIALPFLCSLFIDFHLLCVLYIREHTHTHQHTHTHTHTHAHTQLTLFLVLTVPLPCTWLHWLCFNVPFSLKLVLFGFHIYCVDCCSLCLFII